MSETIDRVSLATMIRRLTQNPDTYADLFGAADLLPCAPRRPGDPQRTWIVSGHEAAMDVVRDPRLGRVRDTFLTRTYSATAHRPALQVLLNASLLKDMTVPNGMRRLLAQSFAPPRLRNLQKDISRICVEVADEVLERPLVDLVAAFANPFSLRVLGAAFGLPRDVAELIPDLARSFTPLIDVVMADYSRVSRADEVTRTFTAALTEAVEGGTTDDGFLDGFRRLYRGGEEPPGALFADLVFVLSVAHDSTLSLIVNSIHGVLSDPATRAAVAADPVIAASFVDEVLRYTPPVRWIYRRALEDADVRGVRVQCGDTLLVCIGAANRDARVFEHPDRFDLRRPAIKTLSFGAGLHFCIGAGLARREAETAARHLAVAAPPFRLTSPTPLPLRATPTLHCPTELCGEWMR